MAAPAFPQLQSIAIGPQLAPALIALVDALSPVPWREFSRIPWRTSGDGSEGSRRGVRYYADLVPMLIWPENAFLRESPTHDFLLRRLTRRAGEGATWLYRFLCLNESADEGAVAGVIPPVVIDDLVARQALLRDHGKLSAAVTFVPFDDHYFVVDSRRVMDAPDLYGVSPAHIHVQTAMQVAFYRTLLGSRRPMRLLEMGCGIGLVALELREAAGHREGADLSDRSIAFAQINRIIRRDEVVRFYQSDLFSRVEGAFDVIIFSPWQPSENYLDLITSFVEQSAAHLTADGVVLLWIGDAVLDTLASVLTATGLSGKYWIRWSYRDRPHAGAPAAVRRLGCLEIRRSSRGDRPIAMVKDAQYWLSDLKQRYAESRREST